MKTKYVECLFLATLCLANTGLCQSGSLVVSPPGPIYVSPGSTISINCTVVSNSMHIQTPHGLQWFHQLLSSEGFKVLEPEKFQQDHINWKTLKLTIKKVSIQDTGLYLCRSARYAEFEAPYVSVIVKKDSVMDQCAETQYTCPDGRCIFQRYRCDYVTDCVDGADEKGCDRDCTGMFRCDNGQCINKDYVCDKFESSDCRDGSDERDCGRIKYGEEAEDDATVSTVEHHDHRFHFNAIYSVVASVVGVACIGTIVVITICRIQMKRETVRRRTIYNSVPYTAHPMIDQSNQGSHRLPWRHRASAQPNIAAARGATLENRESHLLPHRCRGPTSVTLNVNLRVSPEGVPLFVSNDIVKPPPYTDAGPPPHSLEDSPPPPYTTLPHSQTSLDGAHTQQQSDTDKTPNFDEAL